VTWAHGKAGTESRDEVSEEASEEGAAGPLAIAIENENKMNEM
jgi:hypothetical protein